MLTYLSAIIIHINIYILFVFSGNISVRQWSFGLNLCPEVSTYHSNIFENYSLISTYLNFTSSRNIFVRCLVSPPLCCCFHYADHNRSYSAFVKQIKNSPLKRDCFLFLDFLSLVYRASLSKSLSLSLLLSLLVIEFVWISWAMWPNNSNVLKQKKLITRKKKRFYIRN